MFLTNVESALASQPGARPAIAESAGEVQARSA
jgi:hypothetical protein